MAFGIGRRLLVWALLFYTIGLASTECSTTKSASAEKTRTEKRSSSGIGSRRKSRSRNGTAGKEKAKI